MRNRFAVLYLLGILSLFSCKKSNEGGDQNNTIDNVTDSDTLYLLSSVKDYGEENIISFEYNTDNLITDYKVTDLNGILQTKNSFKWMASGKVKYDSQNRPIEFSSNLTDSKINLYYDDISKEIIYFETINSVVGDTFIVTFDVKNNWTTRRPKKKNLTTIDSVGVRDYFYNQNNDLDFCVRRTTGSGFSYAVLDTIFFENYGSLKGPKCGLLKTMILLKMHPLDLLYGGFGYNPSTSIKTRHSSNSNSTRYDYNYESDANNYVTKLSVLGYPYFEYNYIKKPLQ